MKNIVLLGSTGSIGTQTLEVVEKLKDKFNILALAAGKNIKLLKEQIIKFKPKYVSVADFDDMKELQKEFGQIKFFFGEEGLYELASIPEADILTVATSGIVSVKATIKAIENKKTITLANKETLVMAGDIVMKKAKENNVSIIPIDSEHSAILQCLSKKDNPYAKNLWITASGGPFLNNTREEMADFLSISVNDIINFENGKATIELKTFTQICDFLNISIYDVLNEKSDNIIRYMDKELYELIIKCNLEKQRFIYNMVKLLIKNQVV